ncbi:glycosyltransferase [Microbacterium sp. SLBN-146]|uniref:glycosyltransferase family 2 protein n=1 Tax=Microbacterium sp. SLBN-146 TaxID=2768457 RepID=UPI00114FE422|nr:glycosyltransferase [Microbacterium sp. SLBN-146]TQJ30594.1 glycosyl transferase family 2 [Microbacterium sp. SLBN-146]
MRSHVEPLRTRGPRPTVTVVIPHYNYGDYLPTAVESALAQPGLDVDVIIVDDCSSDGSTEVARRIADEHDAVTLVAHETNMRHIGTYNDGLSRATGTYVVLLSADDALTRGSLTRSVALMEANPSVGLVYGNVRDVVDHADLESDRIPSWPGARESWSVWTGEEWLRRVSQTGRNLITNPEVVMRRDVLDSIGGYDARFPHSADLFLWLRAAARADVGRVNGTVQAFYRVHGSNMHATEFGGLLDDYEAVHRTYEAFFDEDGALLDAPERLRRGARRAMAREAERRTVLLGAQHSPESVDRLLAFAETVDPSAGRSVAAYRLLHRRGLRRVATAAEKLRWRVRHHRELRYGW